MLKKIYGDYTDLAEEMLDLATIEKKTVYAILKHEDASELFKELLTYDYTSVEFADLEPVDWDGYDKEYYVTVDNYGCVSVEKAWHKEYEIEGKTVPAGYLGFDADKIFVHSDSNSATIKGFADSDCVEFCFEWQEDFEKIVEKQMEKEAKEEKKETEDCAKCKDIPCEFSIIGAILDNVNFKRDAHGNVAYAYVNWFDVLDSLF